MTRRTLLVRLGHLTLLVLIGWLALRPAAGNVVFDWSQLTAVNAAKQPGGWGRLGDPLPWLEVTVSGNPDEFIYTLGTPDRPPEVLPNPNRTLTRKWTLANPFAPVVGLLFAVCLPLMGRRRWAAVGLAAAVGGLFAGVLMTVLEGGGRHGLIGLLTDTPPVPFLRDAWRGLRPGGWDDLAGRATFLGLLVTGGAAAVRLRPWRTERTAQPERSGE